MKFQSDISQRLTGRHQKSFLFIGQDNIQKKIVLDIGCSYGWFEEWALQCRCKHVIGLEPDKVDFENAQREVPGAEYQVGSALKIPLGDSSVDIAVMWEVIEHLPKNSEEEAFCEIKRVLKNGGELYLSTPNKTFWSCILDPAWWLIGHRHYSLIQLNKFAETTGFIMEKVEYGGGFYELLSMNLLYVCKWLLRREIPFKTWFEEKRAEEFLDNKGWTNIFVKFKRMEPLSGDSETYINGVNV